MRTGALMQMLLDSIAPRALGAYHAVVGLVLLPASMLFGAIYQMLGLMVALGVWHWPCSKHFDATEPKPSLALAHEFRTAAGFNLLSDPIERWRLDWETGQGEKQFTAVIQQRRDQVFTTHLGKDIAHLIPFMLLYIWS